VIKKSGISTALWRGSCKSDTYIVGKCSTEARFEPRSACDSLIE